MNFDEYYLLDEENISLSYLEKLLSKSIDPSVNSVLIVMDNTSSTGGSFKKLSLLKKRFGAVEHKKISTKAKDGLDMALVSYLSMLSSQVMGKDFYIISRDNGYRSAIACLEKYLPMQNNRYHIFNELEMPRVYKRKKFSKRFSYIYNAIEEELSVNKAIFKKGVDISYARGALKETYAKIADQWDRKLRSDAKAGIKNSKAKIKAGLKRDIIEANKKYLKTSNYGNTKFVKVCNKIFNKINKRPDLMECSEGGECEI